MASPVGALISFLMPNAFFGEEPDPTKTKDDFEFYLVIQTLMIVVLNVPTMIFMKEVPPSPPRYFN